jgi:GNAT superfamily N-acetyltransferase
MVTDSHADVVEIPSILPGRLLLSSGSRDDYCALARFHYRPKPPATFSAILRVRYEPAADEPRTVAVAVLSHPAVALYTRDRLLNLTRMSPPARLRWVNRNVRCISRVIVHPTFRSLGLATRIVRAVLDRSPTRYVEALAVMGRAHPLFARAGMTTHEPTCPEAPVYFLFDRLPNEPTSTPRCLARRG